MPLWRWHWRGRETSARAAACGPHASSSAAPFSAAPRERAEPALHRERDDQADCEIADRGERDRLDRLPRLIERGARDRNQVGVADRDGERRVLDETKKLARRRRNDDRQRLWQNDQAESRQTRQP